MRLMSLDGARVCAIVLSGLLLVAGEFRPVAAQESNDITLRLGSTTGNAGDTAEVSLDLLSDGPLPSALILYIVYDEASIQPYESAYERIARDAFTGMPLVDEEGNTLVTQSALLPDPAVDDGNYGVDYQVHTGYGAIAVSIIGAGGTEIPAGPLFTLAFRIDSAVADGSMVDVMGVVEGQEILLPDGNGVRAFATSAADADANSLSYGYENTLVIVGCVPGNAPTGVSATQNRSDGVSISWSAVSGEAVEYRVYRNTTNSTATATPIGEAWQTGTTFLDITARVPALIPGDGCLVPATTSEVSYFYWVRARTDVGCESAFSSPAAEGLRTSAKQAVQAAGFLAVGPGGAGRLFAYLGLVVVLLFLGRARVRDGQRSF